VRLIGYVRVSQVKGRGGDRFQSPAQQADAIRGAAAARGAEVVEIVEDLDQSGGTLDRPGLQRALAIIRAGEADGLCVAKLDRFARSGAGIGLIADLERDGKVFISAADSFDTSTSVGRFALGMMLLVATLERDRHVEMWDDSAARHIARGVHVRATYGYRRSSGRGTPLEPDTPAAEIVREVFRRRVLGEGAAAIERDLNERGVPSPSGRAWTRQQLRAMLRNPVYLGQARRGRHVQENAHPALVDRETWQQAQRAPGVAHRGEGGLLSGLLRCAGCGYVMGRSSMNGGVRYNCSRRTAAGECPEPTSVFAHNVEPHVTTLFLDRYGDVRLVGGETSDPAVSEAATVLEQRVREFEVWRDDVELRDALGAADYRAGLMARQGAVREAEAVHSRAVRESSAVRLAVPVSAWPELSVPEQRALLQAGIEEVWLRRAVDTHAPIGPRVVVRWVGEPDNRPPLIRRGGRP
jgi:DNA invertase Pin-like site-specific DNA recombinase